MVCPAVHLRCELASPYSVGFSSRAPSDSAPGSFADGAKRTGIFDTVAHRSLVGQDEGSAVCSLPSSSRRWIMSGMLLTMCSIARRSVAGRFRCRASRWLVTLFATQA
ncbi:hypothetical protein VFPFJ_10487 [Purpureocillium lilacinum]|uniref:Uncharacterized protein n=1 Tax=Purpureocillium lilacinum TaxID=33203 RepID=A0A179GFU4_PURLI|nr:hypothetical protein VFPFJ_10487 [Purpureocillium lilacinum]OAQ69280.1 hypothetical protein VFPBJ_10655 [Purpureocillium lilacinum]OAQ76705.1 hypothetical protein VFPFJ_10487 [Purpureocillium lilacinum]